MHGAGTLTTAHPAVIIGYLKLIMSVARLDKMFCQLLYGVLPLGLTTLRFITAPELGLLELSLIQFHSPIPPPHPHNPWQREVPKLLDSPQGANGQRNVTDSKKPDLLYVNYQIDIFYIISLVSFSFLFYILNKRLYIDHN